MDGAELGQAGAEQALQRAEMADHVARQLDRALAIDADAQEHGQQFGVRQRRRAFQYQALARTLVFRPVADAHRVSPRILRRHRARRARWLTISVCKLTESKSCLMRNLPSSPSRPTSPCIIVWPLWTVLISLQPSTEIRPR